MGFDDITEEQRAKARACKTPEDLVSLAKAEGVQLTDDQLEEIAGGAWDTPACPNHETSM